MQQSVPGIAQRIVPMIVYHDAPAALDFLCRAFGFEERGRLTMPDGSIGHAEVAYRDGVVMVASATDGYPDLGVPPLRPPKGAPAHHVQIRCYVDDVDAHCDRARAAGARIIVEPQDQEYGERTYRAEDPEGYRWIFAAPLAG